MELDHVAVVAAALERGRAAFARLGFRLTPRSSHREPVPPHGAVADWGSGNHCAMFRQGYLEVLGITDPGGYKAHLDHRLARHEGLHLIGFGTADALAEVADLRARGVAIEAPQRLSCAVPFGEATRPGSFLIASLDPDVFPEADFIVIEQQTRDLLWPPALMDHPTGTVALDRAVVASADPAATIARLRLLPGAGRAGRFDLSPGVLEVIGAEEMAGRLPGSAPPGLALRRRGAFRGGRSGRHPGLLSRRRRGGKRRGR